ncbi:unnamed protein product [Toxocara canis]|uniref:SOCS box domain-containing protein n=1 Tax=Toxocara canis TaxID=6265 RepID=A0A183UUX9_TOXCA|nr:unnamed protein product [Toxocara canis]
MSITSSLRWKKWVNAKYFPLFDRHFRLDAADGVGGCKKYLTTWLVVKQFQTRRSVLPGAVRALVYRMYSLLSAESGASMWDRSMTASSNSLLLISDQYDHVSAFYMLTSAFAILFCILARREPNEAKGIIWSGMPHRFMFGISPEALVTLLVTHKVTALFRYDKLPRTHLQDDYPEQCVHDSELSLRLVHIFMHCFSRLDSSSSVPSSALSSPLLDSTRSPTLFRQMIFAAGYFASLGSRAQMLCLLGWERSVLMQLCMLPMSYFANPVFTAELMPTLIAICFRNKSAIELIKHTLSPRVLVDFLKDAAEDDVPEISRFPKKLWPEAIEYFNSC